MRGFFLDSYIQALSLRAIVLSFTLLAGCAEVRPPSGGPLDTAGPVAIGAVPADGTTGYAGEPIFEFAFSEYVDERTVVPALIVTPRPEKTPIIKLHGKSVRIQFADSLRAGTTYLVALSPALKDLRGNQLTTQVAIRVSTGTTIDTGKITGRVLQDGRTGSTAAGGMVVAAYRFVSGAIEGDTSRAVYRMITAADGEYQLDVLPPGEYVVAAFQDADRNETPNQGSELVGIADRVVTVAVDRPVPRVDIWLPERGVELSPIARQISPGTIQVSGLSQFIETGNVRVLMGDSLITPLSVFQSVATGRLTIQLPSNDSGTATLEMQTLQDSLSLSLTMLRTSDTRAPEYRIVEPGQSWGTTRPDRVELEFSEPMDTTRALSLRGLAADSQRVIQFKCENSFRSIATFRDSSLPERWYWQEPRPADLAGNVVRDSLFALPYRVISADSLGTVSATLAGLPAESLWVRFRSVPRGEITEQLVWPLRFEMRLPAGRYLCESFTESAHSRNGQWTPGSFRPLRFAESRTRYRDTIAVRARFEITGLTLHPEIAGREVTTPPKKESTRP